MGIQHTRIQHSHESWDGCGETHFDFTLKEEEKKRKLKEISSPQVHQLSLSLNSKYPS